jgi:hypothetical protein
VAARSRPVEGVETLMIVEVGPVVAFCTVRSFIEGSGYINCMKKTDAGTQG